MSIRVRLLLSYMVMLLVPLLLLGISVIIVIVSLIGDIKGLYKIDFSQGNPIAAVMNEQEAVFADIKLATTNDPDSLKNPLKAQLWEERLKNVNMGMVVRRNKEVVYSSPSIEESEISQSLIEWESSPHRDEMIKKHNFEKAERFFVTNNYDFQFTDQSQGSVFLVMDASPLANFARKYSSMLLLSLIVILVLTNGGLTYLVSRSIIRPLRKLKVAAEQIKEGNLDYVVQVESKDEIGELSLAFEEMRRRLKDSIGLQIQYEENRKELISHISHDLKTPVTSIKGYVEGIMDGVADTPDKMDKYIKTIYAKATDMDRLIDELFLFSKLDMHKLPFQFEKVNLVAFLQDCVDELQFDLNEKGISLALESSVTAAYAKADREKLKRVLSNVVENAVKYMNKPVGNIRIKLKEEHNWVYVQIEDNGQGIPQEALPHIFERFYRADLSRNSETGGSGLGLSIAKQIIEAHGGEIRATSVMDVGTTILFSLQKV